MVLQSIFRNRKDCTSNLAQLDINTINETIEKTRIDAFRDLLLSRETNPMLGIGGLRLGVTLPEIYTMQINGHTGSNGGVHRSRE